MYRLMLSVQLIALGCLSVGCVKSGPTVHPQGPASVEPMLLRASGACLATIVGLKEVDDRPVDGSHRMEASLQIEESSGEVPQVLRLIINHGGNAPVEVLQEIEAHKANMVLRHDSLSVGERHWFVFSDVYDSSKYPHRVAGWWRYSDGDVPADVVQAVANDRFAAGAVSQ